MDFEVKTLRSLWLAIFLTTVCSFAIAGEQEDPAKLFIEGARHLRASRWAEAERAFVKVLQSWPGQPDVHALLGVARYHRGMYRSALYNLSLSLQKRTKYRARVLYYQGMAYSQVGQIQPAADAFERLLIEYPNSPEARKVTAGRQLAVTRKPEEKEKIDRVKLLLVQDVNHDTNAPLGPDADADTLLFTFASAELDLNPAPLSLGVSAMLQEYFTYDEFDLVHLAGTIRGKLSPAQTDTLSAAYSYKKIWLADKLLGSSNRSELLWKREWVRNWYSDMLVNYGQNLYDENYNENVTGEQTEGRARIWWECANLEPLTRARVFGIYADYKADEKHFGYQSWRAGLELEVTFSDQATLDVELSYGERDYADLHPDFGLVRFDKRLRAGLSFLGELSRSTYLRLNLHHLSSDSNIDIHTYEQTVFGVGLMFLF